LVNVVSEIAWDQGKMPLVCFASFGRQKWIKPIDKYTHNFAALVIDNSFWIDLANELLDLLLMRVTHDQERALGIC
jgi:hypothetical protein